MRDAARTLLAVEAPLEIRSVRIWHCKYRSLVTLSSFKNLETLVVASYPDDRLELLSRLVRLKFLSILHLPRVTDLAPLADLQKLESLSLATLPSWDESGKVQVVASLEPISKLQSLHHLELFGVVPPDRKLTPLLDLKAIASARFSKYPEEEVNRFYKGSGAANAFNSDPVFDAS